MTELELYHYGVKGMRWGVRRYQNSDGSLTNAGKRKYRAGDSKDYESSSGKSLLKRGAAYAAKSLAQIGMMYVADQTFNKGRNTRLVKEGIKITGRAAVTAYMMARGGTDIRWYDN